MQWPRVRGPPAGQPHGLTHEMGEVAVGEDGPQDGPPDSEPESPADEPEGPAGGQAKATDEEEMPADGPAGVPAGAEPKAPLDVEPPDLADWPWVARRILVTCLTTVDE